MKYIYEPKVLHEIIKDSRTHEGAHTHIHEGDIPWREYWSKIKPWVGVVALSLFLICNTTYLVWEQVQFYTALNYELNEAWGISLLCEGALVSLGILGAALPDRTSRVMAKILLTGSVLMVGLVLFEGAKLRTEKLNSRTQIQDLLVSESELFKQQLSQIEDKLNSPNLSAKQRSLTVKEQEKIRNHLQSKSEALRLHLETTSVVGVQTWLVQAMRFFALLWNLYMARVLGMVMRRKHLTL